MEEQRAYHKYLSSTDVWLLSLGCIIGWGAFVMPGTTFLPVAGPTGTVLAILLSAAIMLIIASNYAYLMGKQPGIGGVYSYTKNAFGRDHAFISSWFLCLAYLSLIPQNATALTMVGRTLLGESFQSGFHYLVAGYDVYLSEIIISVAVLIIVALMAIYCKKLLQRVQTVLGILLLLGVLALSVAVLPHISLQTVFQSFGAAHPLQGVFSIVILAPWAFVGFEIVSLETAHFNFKVQKSGRLMGLAVVIGCFMYISMSLLTASVVPDGYASWQDYLADLGRYSGYAAIPTFNAAKSLIGDAGIVIMGLTVVSAILTSVIGFYRASARILTNMAEDHILTRHFSRPSFCFLFVMAVSVLLSLIGRNVLGWVVDLTSIGAIIAFGYASAAAYKEAGSEKNIRMQRLGMGGVIISVIFGLAHLIPYLTPIETMDAESYLLLALWCLLGFLFYWRTMRRSAAIGEGSEHVTVMAMFSLLLYSILVWYIETILREPGEAVRQTAVQNAGVLFAMVFIGLGIMMLIYIRLRRRQVALERENIRAVESSKAKSQFLFNMSHDIRTPMNAIIGFTHLGMQKGMSAEEKDHYLEKIDTSGQQLLSIINDVLDMSRIENERIELTPAATDLPALMEEMRDLFSAQMQERGIAFSVDYGGIEDTWVLCDKNRMTRVLLNLLSNACKFTSEGGRVDLAIRETEKTGENATYEFRVKDSGIGMSREFIEDLFKPFERERTSTVSGIQGTGLGMSITKGIVDLMDGTIEVDSQPGKGTEFLIRVAFPVVDAPEEKVAAPADAPVDLRRIHVLLVEDNAINMEIAAMILEKEGMTVDKVENGRLAVDRIGGAAPGVYDLILMDIQMPVMDGYTAAREIRALPDKAQASIPIIAMTANAFAEDIRAAREAGMDGHIAKPLNVDTMIKTIKDVLQAKSAGGRE